MSSRLPSACGRAVTLHSASPYFSASVDALPSVVIVASSGVHCSSISGVKLGDSSPGVCVRSAGSPTVNVDQYGCSFVLPPPMARPRSSW